HVRVTSTIFLIIIAVFLYNNPASTEIYTLSLHDALPICEKEFWFVVGSQHLYGKETLNEVRVQTEKIIDALNEHGNLPYPLVFKEVVTTADDIKTVMKEINYRDNVAGVITWMHTFSPATMWIPGT